MKSLLQYINEGRSIDEIAVKDQNNKEVNVVYYCYDKDSLDKVIKQYESAGKYWKDKGFFLATLKNKSTWAIDNDKEFHMNTWKHNGEFLEYEDEIDHNEVYTYNELVDLLEKGETMLIVINK